MLYDSYDVDEQYQITIVEAMSDAVKHLNVPDNTYIEFQKEWDRCGCIYDEFVDDTHHLIIQLSGNLNTKELYSTVVHEMKHVEQYTTGKLTQTHWNGLVQPKVEYKDLPWEQEANKFEIMMVKKYASN